MESSWPPDCVTEIAEVAKCDAHRDSRNFQKSPRNILEVLGSPAADRVDKVDSPAAGKDTRQVVLVEVAVRIVGRPRLAVPLVAVVDLRQASGAMCSHNSSI